MEVVHPRPGVEAVVARAEQLALEPRMNVHKNARMTVHGRLLLIRRVRDRGWRVEASRHGSDSRFIVTNLRGRAGFTKASTVSAARPKPDVWTPPALQAGFFFHRAEDPDQGRCRPAIATSRAGHFSPAGWPSYRPDQRGSVPRPNLRTHSRQPTNPIVRAPGATPTRGPTDLKPAPHSTAMNDPDEPRTSIPLGGDVHRALSDNARR